MKLSSFDDVRILSVDYRYEAERERMVSLLQKRDARPRFFIDGKGEQLPRKFYTQISHSPPATWQDGPASYNNFRAFSTMIRNAKNAGNRSLLVAEDDLILSTNFDEVVEKVKVPDDWDMLYYGANHSGHGTREVCENVIRCFGSTCTHLVAFRNTIFDAVLSLPCDRTMDWNIGERLHNKYNCYAIFPSIATQKPGYSYLWKRPVDYSSLWANKGNPI